MLSAALGTAKNIGTFESLGQDLADEEERAGHTNYGGRGVGQRKG
jgi:hypothetical protein